MNQIHLRSETASDAVAIHALTESAFLNAPHAAHTEHLIVDALRDADALFISFVAELQSTIVGHIAVSPVAISFGGEGWYTLGPVSVAPLHQRSGIGSAL